MVKDKNSTVTTAPQPQAEHPFVSFLKTLFAPPLSVQPSGTYSPQQAQQIEPNVMEGMNVPASHDPVFDAVISVGMLPMIIDRLGIKGLLQTGTMSPELRSALVNGIGMAAAPFLKAGGQAVSRALTDDPFLIGPPEPAQTIYGGQNDLISFLLGHLANLLQPTPSQAKTK